MPVKIHKLFPEDVTIKTIFNDRNEATNYIETVDSTIEETLIKDNFVMEKMPHEKNSTQQTWRV